MTSGSQTWHSLCGAYTVVLAGEFVQAVIEMAGAHYPREIGTPLVGTYSDDGWQATVERVAPVSDDSTAGRSWLKRGVYGLGSFFSDLFVASHGRTHYVGEWHSHPDGTEIPSAIDDRSMFEIVADPEARCAECVLVLVAYDRGRARFGVFVYSSRGRADLNLVAVKNLESSGS
jgi:integrative and conjugative element protein (TIGR02256 family)